GGGIEVLPQRIAYEDIGGVPRGAGPPPRVIEAAPRYPGNFAPPRVEAPQSVLPHRPPGCGETPIAPAGPHRAHAEVFRLPGPEIMRRKRSAPAARFRAGTRRAEHHLP